MMNMQTQDQVVLESLLSEIARRLDGAVEFWTTICLEPTIPNRKEWLQKHLDEFRSFVVVIRSLWIRQQPSPETCVLLNNMVESCPKLNNAFFLLEQFQTETNESIEIACAELAGLYSNFRETISKVGHAIGVEVSYLTEKTPEREDYYHKILANLADTFCYNRQPVASVSSGNS